VRPVLHETKAATAAARAIGICTGPSMMTIVTTSMAINASTGIQASQSFGGLALDWDFSDSNSDSFKKSWFMVHGSTINILKPN
jgi:hypothetical protein